MRMLSLSRGGLGIKAADDPLRDGLAANLGDDADTVAAVTGQLAGALYGEDGIPEDWRKKLAWSNAIRARAIRLFELGGAD
jgi:hypothetical protein